MTYVRCDKCEQHAVVLTPEALDEWFTQHKHDEDPRPRHSATCRGHL